MGWFWMGFWAACGVLCGAGALALAIVAALYACSLAVGGVQWAWETLRNRLRG